MCHAIFVLFQDSFQIQDWQLNFSWIWETETVPATDAGIYAVDTMCFKHDSKE